MATIKNVMTVPRVHLFDKLKKLGYMTDVLGKEVTILRNSRFPFQRISIPNDDLISVEWVKSVASDLGISYESLLQ